MICILQVWPLAIQDDIQLLKLWKILRLLVTSKEVKRLSLQRIIKFYAEELEGNKKVNLLGPVHIWSKFHQHFLNETGSHYAEF